MDPNTLLFIAVVAAIATVFYIAAIRSQLAKAEAERAKAEAHRAALLGRIQSEAQNLALRLHEQWRETDYENMRRQETEIAQRSAQADLNEHKATYEKLIRADAHKRGQSSIVGKASEHIAPYLPDFPYNAKEMRFTGAPIDFIVFDGLCDGKIEQVVFIEVKSGKSPLNPNQKLVRDAIENKRVRFEVIRLPGVDRREAEAEDVEVDYIDIGDIEGEEIDAEEEQLTSAPAAVYGSDSICACPFCGKKYQVESVYLNQLITCDRCDIDFEVKL